ncbi:MAG TPA: TonB-dependent receptor [Clostridia bacterium]|nr:TonB-dependent receptor [Clostridia bacterium]
MRRCGGVVLLVLCIFSSGAFTSATAPAPAIELAGKVTARGRVAIADALVSLITPPQSVIATTRTNADGSFTFPSVRPGSYIIRVQATSLSERRVAVQVSASRSNLITVDLDFAATPEELTVTAERGVVEETHTATQQVNVINGAELAIRVKAVTAQAAQEEEGVTLQRTSPTISGVFVRGLTGNRVNVYVDGVRYSTSAQRGGINTFFNLNQASGLDAIEIIRGASSAQYGSDAIGGTVQLIGVAPLVSDERLFSGKYSAIGTTADASYGSNLQLLYSSKNFGSVLNLDGFRANRLRTGGGVDSHSAFARFFGLPSDLFIGSRLPDTASTQYGGSFKAMWTPAVHTHITASYSRAQQDGGRRYDQTLGGDGNLIADLRNLMSDLFYVRMDKYKLGPVDRASLTYSYNAQREERVNQGGNGNPVAAITHEPERTHVHGVQGLLDKMMFKNDVVLGAEYYQEAIRASSYALDTVSGIATVRRGRVPDRAAYRSGGIYLQDVYSPFRKITLAGAARYSVASYRSRQSDSPLVGGKPLWPDDSLRVGAWTYRVGAVFSPIEPLAFFANASRGFRAPHITDLGTLGLTGSGFEVAAPEIAGLGAMVGDSALRTATSSGLPVAQLKPETSQNYEVGVRAKTKLFSVNVSGFINDINDSITKQALILPASSVGLTLGGVPITSQDPTGTVFVAASSTPVLVRANWDDARIWGLEHRGELRLRSNWQLGTVLTYIHAADKRTGQAPNFEGGTPAPDGYLKLRYTHKRGHWWIEPYVHAALRQERLSTLDIEDRRTGATRSRSSIQNFFRRGATVRGFVSPGTDGVLGNADDQLIATGETLAQIQTRVLGTAAQAPLYDHLPGYMTINLRGGYHIGERQSLVAEFENIGDRIYRGISWGVDAPGRSATVRYTYTF